LHFVHDTDFILVDFDAIDEQAQKFSPSREVGLLQSFGHLLCEGCEVAD